MADNFLEKQMEQYRSGRTVIRHPNPSLDVLLHKLAEQGKVYSGVLADEHRQTETDPARTVKSAQLEAALRSARIAYGEAFLAAISESGQCITIENSSCVDALSGIILAVRLKAAELGFSTSITQNAGKQSVIHFYR